MLGGELPALGGSAGLKQDGRALRRRLANVVGLHSKIFPLMTDFMNLLRPGEDPVYFVAQDGAVLPASLPKLIDHFHVLAGQYISLIVRELFVLAEGFR